MKQGSFSWWKQVLRWGVCLLAISVLVGRSGAARADVAPMEPPFGTNPEPGSETTNVRMMAETVLMEVSSDALAHVTASFTMRNLGEKEERMDVGFPLDQTSGWGRLCGGSYPFTPIMDFKAWINSYGVETTTVYETITYPPNTGTITETVPCWEKFPVVFPVGQDVNIQISYTGQPYNHYKSGDYIYSYVLSTGAGWKDTIGSADITVRMPYEINAYNYHGCYPDSCVVSNYEVKWHLEDFKPEASYRTWDIQAYFVPLPMWQSILIERANTANDPKDGEAWGRLGKAYKYALGGFHGYNLDKAGLEMYGWSMDAYQKALELLPNDVDWHFGYAELLCTKAIWNDGGITSPEKVDWKPCLDELQQALALNPEHERARDLAKELERMGVTALSGNQLGTFTPTLSPTIDLYITPSVTQTRVPTGTKKPTRTLISTATIQPPIPFPTNTPPLATSTAVLVAERSNLATLTPSAAPVATEVTGMLVRDGGGSARASTGLVVGISAVVLVLLAALAVGRMRRG